MDKVSLRAYEVLDITGMWQAPVQPELIAEIHGISIQFREFEDDLSGVLMRSNEQTIIVVNKKEYKTRRRFTISHELGHYFLKHKGELFLDHSVSKRDAKSKLAIDPQEIEANAFAAALLMPEKLLVEHINSLFETAEHIYRADLILDLANVFAVSKQAMEYRLVNLGFLHGT